MEEQWLDDVIEREVKAEKVSFDRAVEILQSLSVPLDIIHARHLFKAADHRKDGLINADGFKSIYKAFIYRKELLERFSQLSGGRSAVPAVRLLHFIRKDLCEISAAEETAVNLIAKYEPITQAKKMKCLTFEGFARFMNSPDNHIFRKEHSVLYQDMTLPLNDYFISTSHNTYLLSDQLVGQSHLWGYGSALMSGCRCVEIDCWDGTDGDPVVYHGHTLTSKLPFKTVIYVINQYAFVGSPYPLVLSLENHCSPRQQELMASYLKSILGDKLLTMTVGNSFTSRLPSPEDLKFKILVKNKKIGRLPDTAQSHGGSSAGQVGEYEEDVSEDEDTCDEEELPLTPTQKNCSFKKKLFGKKEPRGKRPAEKVTLAMELSDLVIYMKAVKFGSFQHSGRNQKFYEMNSIGEGAADKLAKHSAPDFISHNMRFITRIYPKGTRATSSNFNPQTYWNVGCQMVALNLQTPGVPKDLHNGKFLDNGGCGFVLKPEFLRNPLSMFDSSCLPRGVRPLTFSIKVISGFLLPPSSLAATSTADPLVSVEVFGVPADQARKQTLVTKNDAFNPQWNQSLTFLVHVPELALVRFCVEDQLSLVSNELLGQYTLPLKCMNKGFRHIPLLNKHGKTLVPASLFVHVWYN
uniref:Phosphoinositide phospholipase C n=1 Tax=Leptobrachium leishanense TaxID=445787 RepID=A0A8C5MIB5_9ANUR